MKIDLQFRHVTLSIVWAWLFIFAMLPFCLVIITSFMSHGAEQTAQGLFTINNYTLLYNAAYLKIFEKSVLIATMSTAVCLLFGYPFAFIVGRMEGRIKSVLLLLLIIPFWTSSLIRSYALIAIIKAKGLLNTFLIAIGIIHQPLPIMFTNYAVVIGVVYNLLPFMILPLMTNIERLDHRLIDAARDLGASRFTTFTKIIIPLTMPGIIAGSILVFLPAMTLFYITDILGGAKSILLGNLIQNQFLISGNWPLGSALSTVLTLVLASLILIYVWVTRGKTVKEWL